MEHGNPGDTLIAQICATQMRELLAARTFNPSIDGFRVLNHELLVSASSSNYSAETLASECESCDEDSDGGVYECDCCYQVYCENCFEETVDAGHSPYRGSIDDEWMLITKDPRIEETSTGSSWTGGAICGTCAAEIEAELEDLPPIHEVMEEEQGTANFSMEGQVQEKEQFNGTSLCRCHRWSVNVQCHEAKLITHSLELLNRLRVWALHQPLTQRT